MSDAARILSRRVLTAGALRGTRKAAAAAPPAIFYAPHQDDEALGLAGSILAHKATGRPVYLVLVTRGEDSGLAEWMNEDPCHWKGRHPCAAGGRHKVSWPTDPPGVSDSVIVAARTAEFLASARTLGVDKVINLKLADGSQGSAADFDDFVRTVKVRIRDLAQQYPGASHQFTAGWLEATRPHKAITDAAFHLMNEGVLRDVRFNYVYAYDKPLEKRADGAAYVLDIPPAHMAIKRNAMYCYNTWDPGRNLYALGYHSVPEKFESAHNDPREFLFTIPARYAPGPLD
ncbi:PIG-L deacetylase family protein [Streptomyces palmae]|uniref:PIG-L family deacetylase n=1 Tax=Streptomyces palmae TaxID=1701085 RepID=A0A4Z0FT89_9ACTN|nr:PIG-L family deacetylase [Streptomyces palmae]TGA84641.1 PIG-L family deacetylase [Streptomyces palmae]